MASANQSEQALTGGAPDAESTYNNSPYTYITDTFRPVATAGSPLGAPLPSAAPAHETPVKPEPPQIGDGKRQADHHQPPPHQDANKRPRTDEPDPDFTRLPDLPPYLAAPPDICQPPTSTGTHSGWDKDLLVLLNNNGTEQQQQQQQQQRQEEVDAWLTQAEALARACGCIQELTTRFRTFARPGSVQALVCQARFTACWRILAATVSGPAWAYMRALGYSRIPVFRDRDDHRQGGGVVQFQPQPVDALYYAREAGIRMAMGVPGSARQARFEVVRMVEEVRTARVEDYPSERHFVEGIAWLRMVLDRMILAGDRQVCESLYDSKPDWAPEWPRNESRESPWVLAGRPLRGSGRQMPLGYDGNDSAEEDQAQARAAASQNLWRERQDQKVNKQAQQQQLPHENAVTSEDGEGESDE
ncbi:hypothetical protein VTK56DRAFT_1944 [Thermocarpiscus australiensis]